MPPASQNTWFFLGAAVVAIVSAAGMYLAEHYKQERRRHAMAMDLARLDRQVTGLQKDLEQLQAFQKENSTKMRKSKRSQPRTVSVLSSSTDDYVSALELDSSDMEFYDLSDDEEETKSTQTNNVMMGSIDYELENGETKTLSEALDTLQKLSREKPHDPEVFWRIGKCRYKLSKKGIDPKIKEEHINKGIEACKKALEINYHTADSHKWFAILIGSRGEFQPIKNRILDGHTFKKHVDIAIKLRPDDATLHHMLGRFAFEVASLKWYERKAATALFSEPPVATYEDALKHLLESEQLATEQWKENKVIIAKCYFNMGNYKEAFYWLDKAAELLTNEDESVDAEIKRLGEKYATYR